MNLRVPCAWCENGVREASLGSPGVGPQPWLLFFLFGWGYAQWTTLTIWLFMWLLSCIQPAVGTGKPGGGQLQQVLAGSHCFVASPAPCFRSYGNSELSVIWEIAEWTEKTKIVLYVNMSDRFFFLSWNVFQRQSAGATNGKDKTSGDNGKMATKVLLPPHPHLRLPGHA